MVALWLGSFQWSCGFAHIAVLASLHKQMDIDPFRTSDNSGIAIRHKGFFFSKVTRVKRVVESLQDFSFNESWN